MQRDVILHTSFLEQSLADLVILLVVPLGAHFATFMPLVSVMLPIQGPSYQMPKLRHMSLVII